MLLSYRQFAIWVLSDLAVRKAEHDRVTFTGNHVCSQRLLPTRLEGETAKQFAVRLQEFRKGLQRYSDASERLALAVKAFMLDGEKSFAAAHSVMEILRKVPAEQKAEYERQGIGYAFRPIEMLIGKTRRIVERKRKSTTRLRRNSKRKPYARRHLGSFTTIKTLTPFFRGDWDPFGTNVAGMRSGLTPWRRRTPHAWRHLSRFPGILIGSE